MLLSEIGVNTQEVGRIISVQDKRILAVFGMLLLFALEDVVLTRLKHVKYSQSELGSGLSRYVDLVLDDNLLCNSS